MVTGCSRRFRAAALKPVYIVIIFAIIAGKNDYYIDNFRNLWPLKPQSEAYVDAYGPAAPAPLHEPWCAPWNSRLRSQRLCYTVQQIIKYCGFDDARPTTLYAPQGSVE